MRPSVEWHELAVRIYLETKDLDAAVQAVNRDKSWVRKALIQRGVYEYKGNYANCAHKGQPKKHISQWEITEDVGERACSKCRRGFKPRSRYIFRCNSCKKAANYLFDA